MTKTAQARLLRAARAAASKAYAPYSKFKVGAAVLDDKDRIHTGCNIENASFGLSICAERVAVFKAVSEGAKAIKAVAVYAGSKELTFPCGACLQVLCEFGSDAEVILSNGKQTRLFHLRDLLPHGFTLKKR